MNETTRPHDAFFKALLTQPGAAGVFLRERLPANVAALLSADEPVLEPASFIDAALREHHSDLLFRVSTVTGTTAFVYVLVEHKSYPDPLVGFQLLRYLVAIWQRYLTDGGVGLCRPSCRWWSITAPSGGMCRVTLPRCSNLLKA